MTLNKLSEAVCISYVELRNAITEALAAPLMETEDDNCLMEKDAEISQWGSAAYGDIWHNFYPGGAWTLGKTLIDLLRDENDPRLSKYAQPAIGGKAIFEKPEGEEGDLFLKRVEFILAGFDEAGASYTRNDYDDSIVVEMPASTYYIGQPTRLNAKIKSFANFDFYSTPAAYVIEKKNVGKPIFPEIVMLTAEAYFLKAEAALKGFGSENPNELYQEGIRQAMTIWDVSSAEADNYIATSSLASLSGSVDEQLEKIAIQRWIAAFTDGFEAWAIVRDFGYPKELAEGVSDVDIFGLGDINGKYPQRMRYGSDAWSKNGENTQAAVNIQGADQQDTKLWWAK